MDKPPPNKVRKHKEVHTESNGKKHFDTKRKTRVKTDASRSGLGAVLEQKTCNGWETISYASRFLNKADDKYSMNELKLLGIVSALEHFENYFLGLRLLQKQTIEPYYQY